MNMKDDHLTVNKYSRSGAIRPDTLLTVLHYTGAPGASAKQIRDYFESLKKGVIENGKMRYASSQYVIDMDGTVLRLMPDNEVAYHCGAGGKIDPVSGKLYTDYTREMIPSKYLTDPYSASYVCIGIEMCHPDDSGKFTQATLDAAEELVVSLFKRYPELTNPNSHLTTHEHIVGWKSCPLWFARHPEDFQAFQSRVKARLS